MSRSSLCIAMINPDHLPTTSAQYTNTILTGQKKHKTLKMKNLNKEWILIPSKRIWQKSNLFPGVRVCKLVQSPDVNPIRHLNWMNWSFDCEPGLISQQQWSDTILLLWDSFQRVEAATAAGTCCWFHIEHVCVWISTDCSYKRQIDYNLVSIPYS